MMRCLLILPIVASVACNTEAAPPAELPASPASGDATSDASVETGHPENDGGYAGDDKGLHEAAGEASPA